MGYGQGARAGTSSFKTPKGLDTGTGSSLIGRNQWRYNPHDMKLPHIPSAPRLTDQPPLPELLSQSEAADRDKLLGETKEQSLHAGLDIEKTAAILECSAVDLQHWCASHPTEPLPQWWFDQVIKKKRERNQRARLHWKEVEDSSTGALLSRLTVKAKNSNRNRVNQLRRRRRRPRRAT